MITKKSPDNQGFWLSYQDSNLDKLIQSQMCYRYTIGHYQFRIMNFEFRMLNSELRIALSFSLEIGCKSTYFFHFSKIFFILFVILLSV